MTTSTILQRYGWILVVAWCGVTAVVLSEIVPGPGGGVGTETDPVASPLANAAQATADVARAVANTGSNLAATATTTNVAQDTSIAALVVSNSAQETAIGLRATVTELHGTNNALRTDLATKLSLEATNATIQTELGAKADTNANLSAFNNDANFAPTGGLATASSLNSTNAAIQTQLGAKAGTNANLSAFVNDANFAPTGGLATAASLEGTNATLVTSIGTKLPSSWTNGTFSGVVTNPQVWVADGKVTNAISLPEPAGGGTNIIDTFAQTLLAGNAAGNTNLTQVTSFGLTNLTYGIGFTFAAYTNNGVAGLFLEPRGAATSALKTHYIDANEFRTLNGVPVLSFNGDFMSGNGAGLTNVPPANTNAWAQYHLTTNLFFAGSTWSKVYFDTLGWGPTPMLNADSSINVFSAGKYHIQGILSGKSNITAGAILAAECRTNGTRYVVFSGDRTGGGAGYYMVSGDVYLESSFGTVELYIISTGGADTVGGDRQQNWITLTYSRRP